MHAPTIAAGSGVAGRCRVLADSGVGWTAHGMDVAGKAWPGAAWNGGGGAGQLESQHPCGLRGRVIVRVDFAFGLGGVQRCRSALSVGLNRRTSRCRRRAGGCPAASHFLLLRQKKVTKEKATLLLRPSLRYGCPALLVCPGRLRNSPCCAGHKQCSPRSPRPACAARRNRRETSQNRSGTTDIGRNQLPLRTSPSRVRRRAAQRRRGTSGFAV